MSGRPAVRGDAFEKFIPTKLYVRFTRCLHRVVGLFNKSCLDLDLAHLGGHHRWYRMPREGPQNWPLGYRSGMAQPIVTKFGMCLETKFQDHVRICTCARADVPPPPFPYLGSGWTGCVEIW